MRTPVIPFLIAIAAASTVFAPHGYAQEAETVSKVIRSIGIGERQLDLSSTGFSAGAVLPLGDRLVGGPVHYQGAPVMELYEVGGNGEDEATGPMYRVALPQSREVLLLGLSRGGGQTRFLALTDIEEQAQQTGIAVINLTGMTLRVRLGEDIATINIGGIYRIVRKDSTRRALLPITIAGESGSGIIPVANSELRLLPERNTLLIVAQREITGIMQMGMEDIDVSVVYHLPSWIMQ